MKFVLFLLQGILESAGLIGLSLALAGIPLRWERIIAAGMLLSLIIYLIRLLPLTFGLHSVAGLLLLTLFIIKTTNIPPSQAFVAVFTSFAILILLEIAINEVFFFLTNTNPSNIIADDPNWKLLGTFQAVLMIGFAFLVTRLKQPQKGVWKV